MQNSSDKKASNYISSHKSSINEHTLQALQTLQSLGMLSEKVNTETLQLDEADNTPWFLQVFLGLSGVLAGIFLTGFVALLLFSSRTSSWAFFLTGAVLLGMSIWLYQHQADRPLQSQSAFISSLAFAISMAGQIYVAVGCFEADLSGFASVWLFLALQTGLVLLIPSFLHRLFSSFFALGCLLWLLSYAYATEMSAGLLALMTGACLLQGYEWAGFAPAHQRNTVLTITKVVGHASALMLLVISVMFIAADYGHDVFRAATGRYDAVYFYDYYLAQGALAVACLYAVYVLFKRYGVQIVSPTSITIVIALIVLAVVSTYVPGLLATSLVIVLAVATGQRILAGLGIVALVGYVFWYYYQLDTTLLVKSASMLVVGISLLVIRHLVVRRYFASSTLQPSNHEETRS